jgi:hypothetical protein
MGETQRETDREGNRGIDIRTERGGGVDNCKRYRKEGERERETLTILSQHSCPCSPVLAILTILFWLSCHDSPVPAVLL